MSRNLRVKKLQTHLFIRAVVPHRQATDGSQGVEQVQPLLWAPNGTVISPGGTLPPTQSIHHPVTKLKQITTKKTNLKFLLLLKLDLGNVYHIADVNHILFFKEKLSL